MFTGVSGKIEATWRPQLELMAFRLEIIRATWPQHRVLPFFIVPVKGRMAAVEGLHSWFEDTLEGWTCVHPAAGTEAGRLLATVGVTEECRLVEADVRRRVANITGWLEHPTAPTLGYSCKSKCKFKVEGVESGFERCWGDLARVTPHMFDLAYMYFIQEDRKPVADRLAREGKVSLWDIPTDRIEGEHADRQFLQLEGMQTGQVILNDELSAEMAQVTYPLHFLDIETTEAILPPHRGARIGALHIFQLSLHRRAKANAALEHMEWLNTDRAAPNRRFLTALRANVGDHGSVLVYAHHERKSLNALLAGLIDEGHDDGDLRWLRRFLDGPRLVDIHAMVCLHVWYPGMAGRTSLKRLLPAVWAHATAVKRRPPYSQFPADKDPYAVLKAAGQISEGCGAMVAYLEMQSSEGEKREQLIRELREYCGIDTLGMVFCWEALEHELAQRPGAQPRAPKPDDSIVSGVGAWGDSGEPALDQIGIGAGGGA